MKRTMWALLLGLGLSGAARAATWPVADGVEAQWSETDAGIEVADLVVGTGEEAIEGAVVEVHYTGMLADGTVFDSSIPREKAFSFRVGGKQVIKGWDAGVQGMKVGGKRRLVIPAELGYGNRSVGPIPPNATLYFEVELLRIVESPGPRPDGPLPVAEKAFRKTRSGLAYADVAKGDGDKIEKDELVCVSYTAWDGDTLVADTRAKGRCWWFRYEHDAVVAGLTEGLRGIRVGGVRQLHIPPGLLQGEAAGEPLAGTRPLVVDVQLVEMND